MKSADVLEEAVRVLDERGWESLAYPRPLGPDRGRGLCCAEAIDVAVGRLDPSARRRALSDGMIEHEYLARRAIQIVGDRVGDAVSLWNDYQASGPDEVKALLKELAREHRDAP